MEQQKRMNIQPMKKNNDLQIIVCPKCGANELSLDEDKALITCDYCGTTFISPQKEVKVVERKVYVDKHRKPEPSDISSNYHETEDYEKLCSAKMKQSFVKFLPLWICAWLSAIIAYVAFSLDVKYIDWENLQIDSVYNAVYAMYITSLIAIPVLIASATTCTCLKAKHLFMNDFCDIKAWKSLSKEERTSANLAWSLGLSIFTDSENHAGFFVLHFICGFATLTPLLFPILQIANFY